SSWFPGTTTNGVTPTASSTWCATWPRKTADRGLPSRFIPFRCPFIAASPLFRGEAGPSEVPHGQAVPRKPGIARQTRFGARRFQRPFERWRGGERQAFARVPSDHQIPDEQGSQDHPHVSFGTPQGEGGRFDAHGSGCQGSFQAARNRSAFSF